MTILGQLADGFLLVKEEVSGPVSYLTASKPTVVFSDLSQGIEEVVAIFADGGSVPIDTGVRPTPAELEFEVRQSGVTPGSGGASIASGVIPANAGISPSGAPPGFTDLTIAAVGLGVVGAPGELVTASIPFALGPLPPVIGILAAFPVGPDSVVVRFTKTDGMAAAGPDLPAGLPIDFVFHAPSSFSSGGAASEVSDGTNLSGETFSVIAIGR